VHDGLMSFPSGHSSMIFSTWALSAVLTVALLHRLTPRHNLAKGLLAFLYVTIAGTVALTRYRDFYHHSDDVLAGATVGFSCAMFAFFLNYGDGLLHHYTREQPQDSVSKPLLASDVS